MIKTLIALCFFSTLANASIVAIIDSGTDYKHKMLVNQYHINPIDNTENGQDEDNNSFPDDVYGWNFAENNNQVIDYKYVGTFGTDAYKFFKVQGKMFLGTATQDEIEWMKSKRGDQEFIKELSKFGNFVHGTHVSGIAARNSQENKIFGIKIIPTEVKAPGQFMSFAANFAPDPFKIMMAKMMLGQLAKQQMSMLAKVGSYVASVNAQVANGSFGIGPTQAKMIGAAIWKMLFKEDPDEETTLELAKGFLEAVVKEAQNMVTNAPKTLFVFAAGNDGNDNDVLPTAPASINADNVITVAATLNRDSIAVFSSYGKSSVHVAAPGVVINSAIPGDEYLEVSGTSQAAPYVANVAGKIFDLNNNLTPKDVKRIIMGTVDKKGFLTAKVATEGIINPARAARAGSLTQSMSIDQAISTAKGEVADVNPVKSVPMRPMEGAEKFVLPLPSMFKL